MEQLLGGPVERFTDQALIKHRAISGQSFFHQDSFYWHLAPEQGCNSWIALDEVGAGWVRFGNHAGYAASMDADRTRGLLR